MAEDRAQHHILPWILGMLARPTDAVNLCVTVVSARVLLKVGSREGDVVVEAVWCNWHVTPG